MVNRYVKVNNDVQSRCDIFGIVKLYPALKGVNDHDRRLAESVR